MVYICRKIEMEKMIFSLSKTSIRKKIRIICYGKYKVLLLHRIHKNNIAYTAETRCMALYQVGSQPAY